MQSSVENFGYQVTQAGLGTAEGKVKAMLEAPRPKNATELRSFLGMVKYYGRFIQNLATLCQPLNRLL